jgi:arsenate reductase
MAKPVIFHNPKCSTSCHALATAADLGVEVEVVEYLKTPPDRKRLTVLVDHLDGPVADLVRKDAYFKELGLDAADYTEPAAVIDLLEREPRLLQRPVLVKGNQVVIGRPKERVAELLQR